MDTIKIGRTLVNLDNVTYVTLMEEGEENVTVRFTSGPDLVVSGEEGRKVSDSLKSRGVNAETQPKSRVRRK